MKTAILCAVLLTTAGFLHLLYRSKYASTRWSESKDDYHMMLDLDNPHVEGALMQTFESWAKAHKKIYSSYEERKKRFGLFVESYKRILHHNSNLKGKPSSYQLGFTSFADWTDDEFETKLGFQSKRECWYVDENAPKVVQEENPLWSSSTILPKARNWVDEGIVSPVKNQGQCGSCWAFSAIGALEAQYKKKHGKSIIFSEQQLLDCSQGYGNLGCNGGFPARAFEYIRRSGGLESSQDYPYEMQSNFSCRFSKSKAALKIERVVNITESNERELEYAVAFAGPVTVAFLVPKDFRLYASGVFTTEECGVTKPKDLTHAVLVVGYGVSFDGMKYWLVKNSWGELWGMKGYFMMERGRNLCGISDCAAYAIVS